MYLIFPEDSCVVIYIGDNIPLKSQHICVFTAQNERMVQGDTDITMIILLPYFVFNLLQEQEEDAGGFQHEDAKQVHEALRCGAATLRWEARKASLLASVPRAPCLTSARRWWRPVGRLPASTSAPRSCRRSAPPSCYSRSSGCSPESQT